MSVPTHGESGQRLPAEIPRARGGRARGWRLLAALTRGPLLVALGGCSLLLDLDDVVRGEGAEVFDGGTNDGPAGPDADIAAPPGCDLRAPLGDSPACIDDAVGVFVSASGEHAGDGTKAAPVRTVAQGLAFAAQRGLPRLYVCEGAYDERIEIAAPIAIHGGLSCAWAFTGAKPTFAPRAGPGLVIRDLGVPVVIEDIEVRGAADESAPGDSAIAAFVSRSVDVTLRNVALSSGPGVDGAGGAARSNYSAAASVGKSAPLFGGAGGEGAVCSCADGTSSRGGMGASGPQGAGAAAGAASPAVGGANAGASAYEGCKHGGAGASGAAGPAGARRPGGGTLSAEGWSVHGEPLFAPNGAPGQGGGGGGMNTGGNGWAGGGGGCGGCGGAGGAAGQSGGSSFALLSFHSAVRVEGGTLTTAAGGAGGGGGAGQDGQAGGKGGSGSCTGGAGGSGAGGSGGGGGAGGLSVPIAFAGAEPHVSGATLTPGPAGPGGPGGLGGAGPGKEGQQGEKGSEGTSRPTLAL